MVFNNNVPFNTSLTLRILFLNWVHSQTEIELMNIFKVDDMLSKIDIV